MRKWIGVFAIVFTAHATAQGLPAGVTPQMLQQLQALPPAQQQALAKQYGITLPNTPSATTIDTLGAQGESIMPIDNPRPREEYWIAEPESVDEDDGAPARYGRDLFNRKVSTFAPTDDAPVPESYRLGVGDQLTVQLFGKENEEFVLQVGRNGDVIFPKLGSVTLAGLTFEDARAIIKTRVAQQLIGVEAVVSMGRLRAIGIFMAGEVSVPGAYSVSALTTVTQALFQAGGVSDIGSLRNIQVKRHSQIVATFDAYDLLLRGDASGDIRLQSGDVVFVPPYAGSVEVLGEVKRPMVYEVQGTETVQDLVSMAGGFTQQAYPNAAILTRLSDAGGLPAALNLDLTQAGSKTLAVENGDQIRVPKTSGQLASMVELKGAVHRPGTYGWKPGLRVSDLIEDARSDLHRTADLEYALIISYKNTLLDISVTQFSLADAIASPGSNSDPELREYDQLIVFSLPFAEEDTLQKSKVTEAKSRRAVKLSDDEMSADRVDFAQARKDSSMDETTEGDDPREYSREILLQPILAKLTAQARQGEPVQIVTISGAVRAPGSYPLVSGAKLADLVKAGGGLKDSAYLSAAELRTLRERSRGSLIATYREVSLVRELDPETSSLLQSRDHLTVRDIPDWSPQDSITISGEVVFPGEYLVQKGERLSSVIARAGGFTEEAFPEGAVFTREDVARKESERAMLFAADIRKTFATRLLTEETVGSTLADVTQITQALETFEGQGRLLVDVPAALAGDPLADIELTDGDALVIPKRNRTVTVVGEVQQPGSHIFQNQYALQDYLSLSAGLSARADDKAMYIVRANGTVQTLETNWWRFSGTSNQIQPGDTIVVPVNTQYKERLASWREITQIVYQSLVSVAAVAGL
ncbi:polysaccharide export protein [Aequoribacter fuscus]|uniref:Polysaccharide export protein n=1 Tax=Aequoribacter fuscus TaxID=2518989 RepID=F3L3S5_9GAMM|nr:SLBB domain-containing protein [Aequoribacter fuscus]EGG29048.1 polysaccharide export protein [Aequoribacter fuscus]